MKILGQNNVGGFLLVLGGLMAYFALLTLANEPGFFLSPFWAWVLGTGGFLGICLFSTATSR